MGMGLGYWSWEERGAVRYDGWADGLRRMGNERIRWRFLGGGRVSITDLTGLAWLCWAGLDWAFFLAHLGCGAVGSGRGSSYIPWFFILFCWRV